MLTVSLTCPGQEGASQSVKSFMALRVKQLVSLLMYGVFAAALGSFFGRLIYEEHREELQLHKAAKEAFNASGLKKLPSVKELNTDISP